MKDTKNSWLAVGMKALVLTGIVIGVVVCIFRLASATEITPRESGLMSILLTILSILATWIVADLYGDNQHKEAIKEVKEMHNDSLRTYALKAAEKVNNLSNELNRLALYLKEEYESDDYDSVNAALQGKEERIESAIHMIQALKSFNDTTLSDWKGVIDDEINQQKQEQIEKEEEIRELSERLEQWLADQQQEDEHSKSTTAQLQNEIRSLREDIRSTSFGLTGGFSYPHVRVRKSTKQDVSGNCPSCAKPITYKQRPKPTSIVSVVCANCQKKLIGTYTAEKGFMLLVREPKKESFSCPQCSTVLSTMLDILPSASTESSCSTCGAVLRIVRAKDEIRVRVVPISAPQPDMPLTEDILDIVKHKLPEQPWPQGIHKDIADQMKLSPSIVSRAIASLIKQGIFLPQIDGKVFVPREENIKAQ